MLRTQIYLPEYEYKKLREKAKNANKTFAQVVRELLSLGLEKEVETKRHNEKKKRLSAGELLLLMAEEAERLGFEGPKDGSLTIDEVVYGLKNR